MQITTADIQRFKVLCKREMGLDLSEDEAAAELRALISLIRLLLPRDPA